MYDSMVNKRPSALFRDGSGLSKTIFLSFTDHGEVKIGQLSSPDALKKEVGTYKACAECSSLNKTSSALCSKSIDKAPCEVGPLNSKGK